MTDAFGNSNGKGNGDALPGCKPKRPKPEHPEKEQSDSDWKAYSEQPSYLLDPVGNVSYRYDKVGNRLAESRDGQETTYQYDKANRLLQTSDRTTYYYDSAGNLTAKVKGDEETQYTYNAAGKLTKVTGTDDTYVAFGYDALGRKVRRTESAWVALGVGKGSAPGSSLRIPPGQTEEKGWGNNADQGRPEKQNDHSQGVGKEKEPCADEETPGKSEEAKSPAKHQKLQLREETTSYLYDGLGLNLLKEYKGLSASKAEYYYANGQVLGRKMFGFKGSILPDREPGLANGGTYWYLTDALGSVTELTDQHGEVAKQYRYDAFGGLFTGTVGLYNTTGLTGKGYDAKAELMDYGARWYDPQVGRFTQVDPFSGWSDKPLSQNPYPYAANNPIVNSDPSGRTTCGPGYDCLGFDVYEWYYYNVAIVQSTTSGVGGYWENGVIADVRYSEVHVHWVTGDQIFPYTEILRIHSEFSDWVSTEPPPPPPPTHEEINAEDNQTKVNAGGTAPSTRLKFYVDSDGQLTKITGSVPRAPGEPYLATNTPGWRVWYTRGETDPEMMSDEHVVQAKKYLAEIYDYLPTYDSVYGKTSAARVMDFQSTYMSSQLASGEVLRGVLDQMTLATLKSYVAALNTIERSERALNGQDLGVIPDTGKSGYEVYREGERSMYGAPVGDFWDTVPKTPLDLSKVPGLSGFNWNQDKVNAVWKESLSRRIDPRLVLAIIPQEGTGSWNTSSTNLAADGQHGPNANFSEDMKLAIGHVQGKFAFYGTAVNKGFVDLAKQHNLSTVGAHGPSYGNVIQFINWYQPMDQHNPSEGYYANHASWNQNVAKYYKDMGGDVEALSHWVAANFKPTESRNFSLTYVDDDISMASGWTGAMDVYSNGVKQIWINPNDPDDAAQAAANMSNGNWSLVEKAHPEPAIIMR